MWIKTITISHGWINIPNHSLWGVHLAEYYWEKAAPLKMLRSKEGKIVVGESRIKELQRGDIIIKVEDENIDEAIKKRSPYMATSNESTLYRDLLPYIFSFYSSPTKILIERDGHQIEINLNSRSAMFEKKQGIRTPESYNLGKYNIGYIDVSRTGVDQIKRIVAENKKGIILDMRIYPKMDAMSTLVPILTDKAYPYVWFSSNEKDQAGNFKFSGEYKTIENPACYTGKVAILVNEGTQSHGEFSAMAYRKAPKSMIIGSQTAGADGNIQTFYLPGNISVTYTGLGTYYPNWEMCQRIGLKIDIPVRPTIKGIKEGRDELLEEAIRYIVD